MLEDAMDNMHYWTSAPRVCLYVYSSSDRLWTAISSEPGVLGISTLQGFANSTSGACTRTITSAYLEHFWLDYRRMREPSSRLHQLSLPGWTFPGHIAGRITRERNFDSSHGFFVCGRRQNGSFWTDWRRSPMKQVRIGPYASSPTTVSWRWIRHLWNIFVPLVRRLRRRCCIGHDWIGTNFIAWHMNFNWHGRNKSLLRIVPHSWNTSDMWMEVIAMVPVSSLVAVSCHPHERRQILVPPLAVHEEADESVGEDNGSQ
ncbi:hypothetical protein CB0940_11632 [Cercospora beticola]|uniref:Uncharacterized protein n=1 Tax=Cercospora beticola TaxID=122368 RepID=A0A2G5IEU4_CERBT|nr:hypothetical protein CB0940_11632 [Cercospora beticola]PIB03182.1 hypothetical protein CB0940_11632 [Cercospora beticola]